MAEILGISRPGWAKQESSGKINEAHWPAITKTLGMSKKQIDDMTEEEMDNLPKGQSYVNNKNDGSNYVCVVNLSINCADAGSVDALKGIFEQLFANRKNDGSA